MNTDTEIMIADIEFIVPPWGKRMATRIQNGLRRGGIHTLSQLLDHTETDLECLEEPGVGPVSLGIVSLVIINRKLESMELKLKGRP